MKTEPEQAAPSFSMIKGLQVCAGYSKVFSLGLGSGTQSTAIPKLQASFFPTLLTLNLGLLPGREVTISAHRLGGSQAGDPLSTPRAWSAWNPNFPEEWEENTSLVSKGLSVKLKPGPSSQRCVTRGHHGALVKQSKWQCA